MWPAGGGRGAPPLPRTPLLAKKRTEIDQSLCYFFLLTLAEFQPTQPPAGPPHAPGFSHPYAPSIVGPHQRMLLTEQFIPPLAIAIRFIALKYSAYLPSTPQHYHQQHYHQGLST